jgi:long-subunit fatty acid transport protein
MMKKIYLLSLLASVAMQTQAQDQINLDTYIGAQLATEDLNGTARYVGMGGAMDALGAEISTMGTNPAGIGLFRSNQISTSMGFIVQEGGKTFQDGSKTNFSFDQVGIVAATRTGRQSFVNVGFNFHKSRNFNYVLSAANRAINGSSQNRQTTIKGIRGDLDTYWGESQVDNLYYNMILEEDGSVTTIDASSYEFDRAHTGYIGEYDFNLSGNLDNRLYLGMTVGVKSVHYEGYSEYFEQLQSLLYPSLTSVLMSDHHKISGTGFDIKAGVIVRPIEESPFRFGLSVTTPTWYKLTTHNTTRIGDVDQIGYDADFRMNTPWKFGVSAGHTIGTNVALGISYEYTDYGAIQMRAITDSGYDWDGYYLEGSSTDHVMKKNTERTLRGVSTLKVGAEFKPDPNIALRVGYNYVSPMYQSDGVRDQTLDSPGVYMASTTDYTNWKSTNRFTAGFGITLDQFRLDLAYQYSLREGDFYPYMNNVSSSYFDASDQYQVLTNECEPVNVKDNRHQVLCTLTYTF